ncbi:TIMELESS-interacting protein [Solea senegalensis]|uniref:TIMELESS-interacting protein n=1 Tax=Solea senegalensis TaxID=28829 RepID=A0AAV6Q543_SOLSE|nr:TIMELESS-interacting protein [Solea senegalensis]KAG7483495.1 TIMELESS-interacting protein [Solea senegalensis]
MVKGLHNISDIQGTDDEAFPPLPPPHSPGGQDEGDPFENGDEGGDVSRLADVPAAKRKTVKRPQPKLDSQRLISERGLPALRTLFDDVHFKGKGHEAADLWLLMQKMENWAHRLYPKLQFDDFIDKVEKLGAKKEVQTCLKRIRLDMPLTHEDFTDKDGEEATAPELHMFDDPDPFNGTIFADEAPSLVHSTPAPAAPAAPSPAAPSLTDEQRRRMELNRQRALERRLARNQQQQTDSQSGDTAPSADESMSFSSENILDKSNNQKQELEPEQELEPISSETQPLSQPPHKDSEPSAKPSQHEEETSFIISPDQPVSSRCEDED